MVIIDESGAGEPLGTIGLVLNYATWLGFAVEVVLMLAVVPDRWLWIRTHPAFNQGDIDGALDMYDPRVEVRTLLSGSAHGRHEVRAAILEHRRHP